MFIIKISRYQITLTPKNQNKHIVLTKLTTKNYINEITLIDIQPHNTSITTVKSSTLLKLSNINFLTIYN